LSDSRLLQDDVLPGEADPLGDTSELVAGFGYGQHVRHIELHNT